MLYLLNETYKVDHDVHDEWKEWVYTDYIPSCSDAGNFLQYRLSRMMFVDDTDGFTYSLQFLSPDETTLNNYLQKQMPEQQKNIHDKYGDKVVIYTSVMALEQEGSGRM